MTTLEPRTELGPKDGFRLRLTGTSAVREPQTLNQAVQSFVRDVADGSLRRIATPTAGIAWQPPALLALLAICYAREIFSSVEIERLMQRDAEFRQLCGQEFPDARSLRRFRRENRSILESCLGAALRFLDAQRPAEHPPLDATELAAESRRRLATAMFLDSMDIEG